MGQLRGADEPAFGGKSTGLGELLAADVPVPPGFALATAALTELMRESCIEPGVTAAAAIRAAPMPARIGEELTAAYRALAEGTQAQDPAVAVRSSAVGEDSTDATFAGQQDTYLWVRGAGAVIAAVRDCWASLYSTTAIAYRARLGEVRAAMGVTVQLMVDASVSGVMFTCNPVSGDPSMVAINASWGLGAAVVGGEVTPDDYLVSKVTGEVVRERIASKDVQCVPDPNGGGTTLIDVPAHLRARPCLDADALGALVALAQRIQAHFGSHQDIEWAIGREGSAAESLFVVQSRPVTAVAAPAKAPAAPASALSLVMSTFGVRPRETGEER
ncbi:MAG TPA: PEP/pyruvate-binding domain-containing protein [Solirubrobacteraceae bacterium]|nr:PEP/pyruvate-binding domain-containing protein [Solirubrobacteraceae bacterium]